MLFIYYTYFYNLFIISSCFLYFLLLFFYNTVFLKVRDKALATFNSGLNQMVKSREKIQKRFLQDLKSVTNFCFLNVMYHIEKKISTLQL